MGDAVALCRWAFTAHLTTGSTRCTGAQLLVDSVNVSHNLSVVFRSGKVLDLVSHSLNTQDSVVELIRVISDLLGLLSQNLGIFVSLLHFFVLLLSKDPSIVLFSTTVGLLVANARLPSLQLSFKLFFAEVLVHNVIRGEFCLLLLDVFAEDLGHAGVHPVDGLTTAGLFTILFSILPLTFLFDSTLEHSGTHLRHLLLLLTSNRLV